MKRTFYNEVDGIYRIPVTGEVTGRAIIAWPSRDRDEEDQLECGDNDAFQGTEEDLIAHCREVVNNEDGRGKDFFASQCRAILEFFGEE